MKVLLLAAGRGTRISRYLAGNPKCTVDIGGQKLIQYTIELFHKKGITDIAMVLGYRAEVIQETLKDYEGIRYFYNPFFDVTNSIASAWFAKDFLSQYDDTLIMNADVYLEETLLDRILECHKSPVMFADGTRKEEADYKYKYENGLLVKYGKELTGSDITGEYIGIGRFSKDFMPEFMEKLDGMIRTQQHSVWWENILYEMVGKRPVYVEEMDGLFWAEVDYVEDYERILRFRGYKADFSLNVEIGFFFLLVCAVAGMGYAEEIVSIFRKGDPAVVATGAAALRWQFITYPLGAWIVVSNMMLQTIRKPVRATILSSARQGLFFIPLIFILPYFLGLKGVEMCQAASDMLTFFLAIPLTCGVLAEMKRKEAEQLQQRQS